MTAQLGSADYLCQIQSTDGQVNLSGPIISWEIGYDEGYGQMEITQCGDHVRKFMPCGPAPQPRVTVTFLAESEKPKRAAKPPTPTEYSKLMKTAARNLVKTAMYAALYGNRSGAVSCDEVFVDGESFTNPCAEVLLSDDSLTEEEVFTAYAAVIRRDADGNLETIVPPVLMTCRNQRELAVRLALMVPDRVREEKFGRDRLQFVFKSVADLVALN